MNVEAVVTEDHTKLTISVSQREKQERLAEATLTSDTLKALNITLENLPQKCQQILNEVTELQTEIGLLNLDPISITNLQTKHTKEHLEVEYEVLKLKQKNKELENRIEENKKFLEQLRRDLKESKEELETQNPNPGNIMEHIRQIELKVNSYEEVYEKAKSKYSTHASSLSSWSAFPALWAQLGAAQAQESALRARADDVTLAREALLMLRRQNIH